MIIQSLTLYSPESGEYEAQSIRTQTDLKQQLTHLLSKANVDLSDMGEDGIELPELIAEADTDIGKLVLSYTVLENDSGLLSFYFNDLKNKLREKDIGHVDRVKLENVLISWLSLEPKRFIEQYLPPRKTFTTVTYTTASIMGILSIFGVISSIFSDIVYRDEMSTIFWQIWCVVYILAGGMLLALYMTDEAKDRRRLMPMSLWKVVPSLFLFNGLLTFGLVFAGGNIGHWLTSKPTQQGIVFESKARHYSSKSCNGSVYIEHFSGALCLENKPYWDLIKPGMKANATGNLSSIGLSIETIELLPPKVY